jgi:hypothetical protein
MTAPHGDDETMTAPHGDDETMTTRGVEARNR